MILDRPARGRGPGPVRSPLNTEESTETMCKDDWLMRLGDHGRTVIMAVPPTAHAMSGIHQQHDPVDVKSLRDTIHFAAHRCARAESVRGKETVVRRASMPRGPCVISHARPTGQCSTDLWIASRSANSTPRSPDSPKSQQGKCVDGNASISCFDKLHVTGMIVPAGCPGARKRRSRVG
jgi:hypothetical protein